MRNIVVFVSGKGTNLEAIINAIQDKVLNAKIVAVISNNADANALTIAKAHSIPSACITYDKNQSREEYDSLLVDEVQKYCPDLIVLAGWMRLFTNNFLERFSDIINLHPALPGTFPGSTAIKDAYKAFGQNKINKTGVMVHRVIKEMDAGEVLDKVEVPIYDEDTLEALETRVKYFEKALLIRCIQKVLDEKPQYNVRAGKVRDIYEMGSNKLCIVHSNRLSAFDRHVCDIPHKGNVLNLTSKYWFDATRHIVPNHMLYTEGCTMIATKCTPFPIEVVVRGYITGNTNTSLWTHYANGSREYCGIKFSDGLIKNQKIETVLTPTTKGDVDEPISEEDIVTRKFMTQDEWDYVAEKALELFKFGQQIASSKGFILVDTKYEFGRDKQGNILLIDEIHTCDSSRFWVADSYKEKFDKGEEPEKLDKDCIRDYLKKTCDPYKDELNFPSDHFLIDRVSDTYLNFYTQLTGEQQGVVVKRPRHYFPVIDTYNEQYVSKAIIIAGSISDNSHVMKIKKALDRSNIYSVAHYSSAHKNTRDVIKLLDHYNSRKYKIVWITVAGRSNALSGVMAANSRHPVIACPPFKDKMDMQVNINSTLQCPSNVPVMTILEPGNVAIAIERMFNL